MDVVRNFRRVFLVVILSLALASPSVALTPAQMAVKCFTAIKSVGRKVPRRFSLRGFVLGAALLPIGLAVYLHSGHEIGLEPTVAERNLMGESLEGMSFHDIEGRLPAAGSLYIRAVTAQDSQLWNDSNGGTFYKPYHQAVQHALLGMMWVHEPHFFCHREVFRDLQRRANELGLPFPAEEKFWKIDAAGNVTYIGPPSHEWQPLFDETGLFQKATQSDLEALAAEGARSVFYHMIRREYATRVLGNVKLADLPFTPEHEKKFQTILNGPVASWLQANYLCQAPDQRPRRFDELFNYFEFGHGLRHRVPSSADIRRKNILDWIHPRPNTP